MFFDSRCNGQGAVLGPGSEFSRIDPDQYGWASGYAFEGKEPRIGAGLSRLVAEKLRQESPDLRLRGLNGSYCAVILSPKDRRIDLVADRWGTRPLYYAELPGGLLVGDDFWELAAALESPRLSADAAIELLNFDYVLGERTLIEQIMEAPFASRVTFQVGNGDGSGAALKTVSRYWTYDIRPQSRNAGDMIGDVAAILDDVGERHVRALKAMGAKKIGLNLTAGYDSRVIGYMLHKNGMPFHCFTSRDIGGENQAAIRVSQVLGVGHTFIPSWTDVLPQPDDALFWTLAPTSMFFANHTASLKAFGPWPVDGFIAGHMGDPVTGRQATLREYWIARHGRKAITAHFVKKHAHMSPRELVGVIRQGLNDRADTGHKHLEHICNEAISTHDYGIITRIDGEQRQRRFILRDYVALCGMGPSILPFADNDLWDFFSTVPFGWQIRSLAYASALAEHLFQGPYRELGNIPVNGVCLSRIRHPMWHNYKVSAHGYCQGVFGRMTRKVRLSHELRRGAVGVFNEAMTCAMKNGLEPLEWLCDIDKLAQWVRASEGTRDLRALYTLWRVSSRVQKMDSKRGFQS